MTRKWVTDDDDDVDDDDDDNDNDQDEDENEHEHDNNDDGVKMQKYLKTSCSDHKIAYNMINQPCYMWKWVSLFVPFSRPNC